MEKSVLLYKIMYHYLNMIPTKIQFGTNFKLYPFVIFTIRSYATKILTNTWDFCNSFQKIKIFAIFSENFELLRFFPEAWIFSKLE